MTPTAPAQPLSIKRAAALNRSLPVLATTPLGTVDAAAIADVDRAGWVQLRGEEWSLDWWVGAEDRWHQPAGEAAVRQQVLGDSPVVQTAMRVPGGDVLQRAYAVRASSPREDGSVWEDSGVVVEVENGSAVPVALALVLRPFTLAGPGGLTTVDVDGSTVTVGGRVALVLSRPVARVAHGAPGSVADRLAAGDDVEPLVSLRAGEAGLEVALVVPLPHTATTRVLLPRVDRVPRRRWFGASVPPSSPGTTFHAPEHESIVSGWSAHTRDAARVELADPTLDPLVAAAARSLVLGGTDHVLERADRAVAVTELLARSWMPEPLEPLARALVDAQRLNGALRLEDGVDATAALLFAAAPLLVSGPRWPELLVGPVAKSVHFVRKGSLLADPATWSAGAAALALVAPSLRRVGQPEVADDAAAAALELQAKVTGATPSDRPERAAQDLLRLVSGLRASMGGAGSSTSTAASALDEIADLARLGTSLSVADSYDERGVPAGELGYDPGALAARACALIDLVVRDVATGPALLTGWSDLLWGRPIEAHRVATRHGRVSFGLRWHGIRPAVLWEVEPWPGVESPDPVLRAPSLDPGWVGSGWSGEALLCEVEPPEGVTGPMSVPERSIAAGTSLTPTLVDLSAVLPAPPSEGQSFS